MKRLSTIVVTVILLLLLTQNGSLSAQSGKVSTQHASGFCGHSKVVSGKHFPAKIQNKLEQRIYEAFQQPNKLGKSALVPDYTLPVVVHIIHDNGAENIPDATVLQGIQHLNDAFANVGYYDPTTGVDTEIQFCLAKRDPDGNATTGINRVQSSLTDLTFIAQDIALKDLSRWDPERYINIWLVREICDGSGNCGVAGYAYLPSSHGEPEDGIVMEAEYFGSSPGGSGVQVHEMGHYLGLYHTFEGGCTNDDCLTDGDRVCDTPPDQSTAAVACNEAPNSCSTDTDSGPFGTDQPDLFQDYMDYGDFDCWSVFTQGQADRMGWFIENVRFSLLESQGCLNPCTSNLSASFSVMNTVVYAGAPVGFVNGSTNATTATWEVDGVFFSSALNPSYTFPAVGTYEVCLTAGNADPNCNESFCMNIFVECSAIAGFTTSDFYPAPGEVVNYTNSSSGANTYQWRVNGVLSAATTNFSTSFPANGTYEVCLTAGNGTCSEEFCMSAFVSTALPPGECDTSFLKTYGTAQDDEIGLCMVNVPAALGGGYLIGGGKGDSAMMTLLDANANIVWTRAFDATPFEADFIWDIKFDSENRVFGSGQTKPEPNGNIECFAFRYNMVTNTMNWINELDLNDPAHEIYLSMLEKTPGGNYIVAGQVTQNLTGGTGCDGIILELNRNTGTNVWQENYNLGSCETFQRTIIYNSNIYATGRFNFDNFGEARMRPGIMKMDLSGNQIWSRLYLRPVTSATTARLYSSDIIADNGLVVLGQGDFDGISTSDVDIFLYRTDANGEIEWAMQYDIPGASSEVTSRLYNLPDGYLCLGYFTAGNQDAFIFKTDKDGALEWAKAYGSNQLEDARDVTVNNGVIYFVGKSNGLGSSGSEDLFLASLSLDGSSTASDSCDFFKDLDMTALSFPNPYDGQHNLASLNQTWSQFINVAGIGQTSVQAETACVQTCIGECDLVPDAVFEIATASCDGNSLIVNVTICNEGNFPLPAGTPLTIYGGNPTSGNPAVVGTFVIPDEVKKDSCNVFSFTITGEPNTNYFVMLNDDGTTPRPFSLATYESDATDECDYSDNLGSFSTSFTAPVLNLGPNLLMCEFGVQVLDAGPNFAAYHWQDGSSEQTLTAFAPGTYSVTVTDACGGTQTDQLTITVDPTTVLDLGPDIEVCMGGSYTFNLPTTWVEFDWTPASDLSCTDCADPTVTPTGDQTYVLIATNADGCIGVDTINVTLGPGIQTAESLALCEGNSILLFGQVVTTAGVYSEVFTSIDGCDSTHTVTVNVLPNISTSQNLSICLGETVNIFGTPIGTAGVYVMTFVAANGCDSTHTVTLAVLPVFETSESLSICEGESIVLFGNTVSTAGTYEQTFTAGNGCDSTHSVTVTVLPNAATVTNLFICFGATANIHGNPVSTAGTYVQTFPAANGCDSVSTVILTVNPAINIGFSGTNVTCFGGSDGSAQASVSGGFGSYAYNWDTGATTADATGLAAGSYVLTVTDGNFCAATASVSISQPTELVATATGVNVSCTELGSAACSVSGGNAPYSFAWNTSATTASISGLIAGIYTVTATDDHGCTDVASVTLTGGLGPQVSVSVDQQLTPADPESGALTANISGGTAPIGVEWSNGETTASINGLSDGDYYVTLTDANGCTASDVGYLFLPACTGGKVWHDIDRDGCQDPGEIGIANVTMTLTGTTVWGVAIAPMTTTTGNIGEYLFEGLAPGTYAVSQSPLSEYSLSPADACGDDSKDSDFAPGNATAPGILLTSGHCCLTVDCALHQSCLNVTNPGTLCCNQSLCGPGDAAPITGTPAVGSAGAVSYLWMYSYDLTPFNPTTWSTVYAPNGQPVTTASYDPGILSQTTYFIRCAIGAGCTDWMETNVVSITVGNTAVADIQQPGTICVGQPETMTALANPTGATYAWNFGQWSSPSTSTLQSLPVTWSQPGYTTVTLSVTYNGCTSTDALAIGISNSPSYCGTALVMPGSGERPTADGKRPTALGSMQTADGRFSAYPNPAHERLTIEWSEAVQTAVSVRIYSMEGQLLHLGRSEEGTRQYSADLSNWLPGMYLLRLSHGDGEQVVMKWVRQ